MIYSAGIGRGLRLDRNCFDWIGNCIELFLEYGSNFALRAYVFADGL